MTKVAIIGAGKGGRALLEMFAGDPTVTILGVADVNPWAPGLELARRLNIPVATDLRGLIADPRLDLVIDVTGSPEVQRTILELKPAATEVMGGAGARFMWDLLAERKRSEELEDRYSLMLRELQAQAEGDFIIGQNPKMKEVAQLIVRVAATPTTVLILGESGTGKELVARAIHRYSNLRDKPLITVNCTALAPTLLESELFGHKRGAFTGAVADKPGLFEKADGGTIFLDEVGDMAPEMQSRLLRVLQTGESKPVGDVVTRKVRPVLAHHFLRKAEAKVNKKVDRFAPEALDLLKRYPWPGNLRELENIIERAVVLATSRQIEVALLPLHLQESVPVPMRAGESFFEAKERAVARVEREAIERFLGDARGNVSAAAKLAGITRRNLHRLIVKYGIDMRSFRTETGKSQ